MADEIMLDDLAISPGVLETIAVQAAEKVEGVQSAEPSGSGLAGLVQRGSKSVTVGLDETGELNASLHLRVSYGQPVNEVAESVKRAVADALSAMTGKAVVRVDVFVDGIVFP